MLTIRTFLLAIKDLASGLLLDKAIMGQANVLTGALLNHPRLLSPAVVWVPGWFKAVAAESSKGSFSLICQMCKMDWAELCSECTPGL